QTGPRNAGPARTRSGHARTRSGPAAAAAGSSRPPRWGPAGSTTTARRGPTGQRAHGSRIACSSFFLPYTKGFKRLTEHVLLPRLAGDRLALALGQHRQLGGFELRALFLEIVRHGQLQRAGRGVQLPGRLLQRDVAVVRFEHRRVLADALGGG